MKIHRVIPSVLASIAMIPGVASAQAEIPAPEKKVITSEELAREFVVQGPLGHPLGEVITVEGIAVRNIGKGDIDQFQVTSVEGKGLKAPVQMSYRIWGWSDIKKLEPDQRYTLRVYQDGGFAGVPEQAMKETTFVQTHAYTFVTNLVIVRNAAAEK